MITVIFIGTVSACLTLFINYCMGRPGGEFSPYEIFSGYTVWLSKMRLKNLGLLQVFEKQFKDSCKEKYSHEVTLIIKDYHKILYNAAEPFFTWERMVGMCPVCFGFWVSLTTAFLFTKDFVHLVAIIVISHVVIRILNKIL